MPNNMRSDWLPPEWWNQTEPYRQTEAAKFLHDVAVKYPKGQIPWSEQEALAPHVGSDGTTDEVHLALDVPEWVRKKIAEYVGDLDVRPTELVDPMEYHITVAYAEHGVENIDAHAVLNQFNLAGLKFEGGKLRKLGDAGALVLEFDSENFDDYASMVNDYLEDEWDIEVSRYDDGYTPHITVAYIHGDVPKVDLTPLSFRTQGMSFSTPRKAPEIPSIWARHMALRLAATHFI